MLKKDLKITPEAYVYLLEKARVQEKSRELTEEEKECIRKVTLRKFKDKNGRVSITDTSIIVYKDDIRKVWGLEYLKQLLIEGGFDYIEEEYEMISAIGLPF